MTTAKFDAIAINEMFENEITNIRNNEEMSSFEKTKEMTEKGLKESTILHSKQGNLMAELEKLEEDNKHLKELKKIQEKRQVSCAQQDKEIEQNENKMRTIKDEIKECKTQLSSLKKEKPSKTNNEFKVTVEYLHKNNLKTCKKLSRRLFKIAGTKNYAYYDEKGELKIIPRDSNEILTLHNVLLEWFKKYAENYTLVADDITNTCKIDHEKHVINTFPQQRFSKNSDIEISDDDKTFVEYFVNTFVKDHVCRGNDQLNMFMLNYLAYLVHNKKTEVIIYLYGLEGSGKSLFLETIRGLLGNQRCVNPSMTTIAENKFNSYLVGSQVVVLEETTDFANATKMEYAKFDSVMAVAKEITTKHDEIDINGKFERIIRIVPQCNYIFSSNYKPNLRDVIGRRFSLFDMNEVKDKSFYEPIFSSLHGKFSESRLYALWKYFSEYEITIDDLQKYFETIDCTMKQSLKHVCVSNAIKFCRDEVLKDKFKEKFKCIHFFQEYEKYCKSKNLNAGLKTTFYEEIKKVKGITKKEKALDGCSCYIIDKIELKNFLTIKRQFDEDDEVLLKEKNSFEQQVELDHLIANADDEAVKKIKELQEKLMILEKQNENLRQQLEKQAKEKVKPQKTNEILKHMKDLDNFDVFD